MLERLNPCLIARRELGWVWAQFKAADGARATNDHDGSGEGKVAELSPIL
ncbi:hypothetical protein SMC26_17400 [Actinomadura fulvescens]